jgi:hypothetical protein
MIGHAHERCDRQGFCAQAWVDAEGCEVACIDQAT